MAADSRFWLRLTGTALVALALRAGVAGAFRSHMYAAGGTAPAQSEAEYLVSGTITGDMGDSRQYLLLGRSILRGRFSWNHEPNTFRTPGYPLLIALCGGSIAATVVVQIILSALSVVGLGLTARRLFGERSALVAAGLLAVDVPHVLSSGVMMAEALLVAAMVGATLLFAHRRYVLAGLALGFAVLVRPIAVLSFVPFGIALAARREWRGLAWMLVSLCILPGGWLVRNYLHYDRVSLTSNGGYNLYYANAAALVAAEQGTSWDSARYELADEFRSQVEQGRVKDSDNPLRLAGLLTRKAVAVIVADPIRYAWLHLRGTAYAFAGIKSDDILRKMREGEVAGRSASIVARPGNPLELVLAGLELFLALGSLGVAVAALFRGDGGWKWLFLSIACYFILAAAPFTDGRFRVPAMPFVYLCAASLFASSTAAGQMPGRTRIGLSSRQAGPRAASG